MRPIAQGTQSQQPVNNQPTTTDTLWSMVGQYGVGIAAFVTILKMYADYQLKAAIEDRAMKVKKSQQGLELEGRVFSSLLSQQENSATSTGQLLNTFIAKTLDQAEATNEQTSSLIATIGTLTEAIKFLGDTQQQQLATLNELKGHAELELLTSIKLNTTLITQVLTLIESLVKSNVNGEG